MKCGKYFVFASALAAASAMQTNVEAVPYASLIDVSSQNIQVGGSLTITYVLNEAASVVTINILDNSDATVATFAGTPNQGANSVVWDGTVDNSGGADVAEGTGFKVQIVVDGSIQNSWTNFAANQSGNQPFLPAIPAPFVADMPNDSFPKDVVVQTDPTSDYFGTVLVSCGYGNTAAGSFIGNGWFPLNTALQPIVQDTDGVGRVIRHPSDAAGTPGTYDTWGGAWDPTDPELFWSVGQQGEQELLRADNTNGAGTAGLAVNAIDADPTDVLGAAYYPRNVAIYDDAGTKYALLTASNSSLGLVELDANNNAVAVTEILDIPDADRYSKTVRFDSDGNIYWGSRRQTGTTGARLYRWTAATFANVLADPVNNKLTEAGADWLLNFEAAGVAGEDVLIGLTFGPGGEVYVMESDSGIYEVGNISDTSLTGEVPTAVGSLIIDFAVLAGGLNTLDYAANIAADAFGNLYMVDGGSEAAYAFSPPTATPPSTTTESNATFGIVLELGAENWSIYR